MINLNSHNGADKLLANIHRLLMEEFPEEHLIGCEMGVAYAGGVEEVGKTWGERGTIHAFDTFEGHPDYVAKEDPLCDNDINSYAARCMDFWYDKYKRDELSIEYIQSELDRQGLSNVILHKGLITKNTDVSFLPRLHYCFLDLDIPLCMADAYSLIRDKIVPGGYLCLHDVVHERHIKGLFDWYKNTVIPDNFEVVSETGASFLAILRKLK